jgi:SPP1 gp7 family putative phage head morphogenesis protein
MTRAAFDKLDADAADHAFTVSGVAQADMVERVWNAIDDAVANGTDLEDFRASVADDLYESWGEEDPARLETIFRTNVNQAYNDGREEIFSHPAVAEARPYWRYELIDDDALCDQCGECEDVTLPADDEWWDDHRPILHPNCRCSFTALTEDEAREEGLSDDDADPEVADGFGDERDEDYSPNLDDYADEIGDILKGVLEQS